ncbi:MAG TPA: TIGR03767 family metallophosphoesterase [Actinomycetota bacterium]|nr:TIGR03767 family metallophosphoesterase [Actinomycetota bacterium]
MSRRHFLRAAGAAGAASMVPWGWADAAIPPKRRARELTTLARTIVKGAKLTDGSVGSYYQLAYGPGEKHLPRFELAKRAPGSTGRLDAGRRSLFSFAHYTDTHLIDGQSPARVEFLDRYNEVGQGCEGLPFASAYRPQEMLTLQIFEAMNRRLRAIQVSPVTGAPITITVCTGDNIDNEQFNELRWFIDMMDGSESVSANSGGPEYEGVMAAAWGDPEYWHPDPEVEDKYKQQFGFPSFPGLLTDAIRPFKAVGVGMPWLQTLGNHDGLLQGNAPKNPTFEAIAVGGSKVEGLPPGVNPCDAFQTLRDNPAAFATAPMRQVTRDADRTVLTKSSYIEEMFKTTGKPIGHGFSLSNKESGAAYWSKDSIPGFRMIGLDTVNPGGYSDGSIGQTQFDWLQTKLTEVSSRYFDGEGEAQNNNVADRYVIIFSHHGLRSLDNPVFAPDPFDPTTNDSPRILSEEIEALLHRFPNVIAWVNGHSHRNIIEPRPGATGTGFWDIGTAAHIDWGCQSRLIDVVDNNDGTLSIFCTVFDHAAPPVAGNRDPVIRLASIARELAANDNQGAGFASAGLGEAKDRNVELLIKAPFRLPARRRRGVETFAMAE